MSVPAWGSASNTDQSVVTAALRRVVSVEGARAFADAGRLGALLMDELGADGRRHRPAVDAMTSLAADVGTALSRTPAFQIGTLLAGWVTTQQRVAPAQALWAGEAAAIALNVRLPGPVEGAVPAPQQAAEANRRVWLIPLLAFLTGAVVLGGIGFAVGTTTGAPIATVSTTTVTTATTVTETAPPPAVVAVPADIASATIAGTWNVTLAAVDCQGVDPCPAAGETLVGVLEVSCQAGTCGGTFLGDPVSVTFDPSRGAWVMNGALGQGNAFSCNGVPGATAQDWLITVAEASFQEGEGWQASSLTGQRTISSGAEGGCTASYISYSVTAVPA